MTYRQCRLKRGATAQIAWIPQEFAKIGRYLEIQGENGWLVEGVYGRSAGEYLTTDGRDYRKEFGSLA